MWHRVIDRLGRPEPAAAHETARGLAEAGAVAIRTMNGFDEMCLTPVEAMTPEKIRALRMRENASQAVFARHLNLMAGLVTTGLVSQWERGGKRPRGASLKRPASVANYGLGAVAWARTGARTSGARWSARWWRPSICASTSRAMAGSASPTRAAPCCAARAYSCTSKPP